nr:MAG TPA: hypothetical protein [Caudoviricetes sp.]
MVTNLIKPFIMFNIFPTFYKPSFSFLYICNIFITSIILLLFMLRCIPT